MGNRLLGSGEKEAVWGGWGWLGQGTPRGAKLERGSGRGCAPRDAGTPQDVALHIFRQRAQPPLEGASVSPLLSNRPRPGAAAALGAGSPIGAVRPLHAGECLTRSLRPASREQRVSAYTPYIARAGLGGAGAPRAPASQLLCPVGARGDVAEPGLPRRAPEVLAVPFRRGTDACPVPGPADSCQCEHGASIPPAQNPAEMGSHPGTAA